MAKKDKRSFYIFVYRVGDLDRTIKFYTECFGMKLLRKRDIPEEKYSNAFLRFGPEESNFVVELTNNYGVDKYDIGTGFGHFFYCNYRYIRAKGGNITREPGPVKGGTTVIAFVKDPDGYIFEPIQRGPTPEPFCQVMLRVGDLDRSIKFYEKALGMKMLKKIDMPYSVSCIRQDSITMMGYADEMETTVLELTYNYGVTEYTKGNAYAQVAINTDDVYKTAEVVNLVTQEIGGKITRQPGPIPGINTKITSFLDPVYYSVGEESENEDHDELLSKHAFVSWLLHVLKKQAGLKLQDNENMTRMLLVTDVQDIIKRHQSQIITSLKDPDIRYVDVILQLIDKAGDFVSDDIWFRVVQFVTNNEDLQPYAAVKAREYIDKPATHETMVKVCIFCL
ncbi:hypothetical protein LOK49_LG05G02017 [Camellia lanceoleosa]|uniref:Uncharacterized protein n=1 Tax=Camellia lanceoleosa TaxID=1840588 RepID=A0ACC0HUW7_9ERIC|nr:hypothetical protein LOK49_LG05G02017 [Camellia lanceoleosa]